MVNHVRRRMWIAAIILAVYWLALFTATHVRLGGLGSIGAWDKELHFFSYLLLALLLAWVLHGGARPRLGRHAAALLICAGYGALDEFLQRFVPGRVPDFNDWLADMGGAGCGLMLHQVAHVVRTGVD